MDVTDERMAMRAGEFSLHLSIARISKMNPQRDTARQEKDLRDLFSKEEKRYVSGKHLDTLVTPKEIEMSITLKTDKAKQQHATLGRVHILQSIFIHHSPFTSSVGLLR